MLGFREASTAILSLMCISTVCDPSVLDQFAFAQDQSNERPSADSPAAYALSPSIQAQLILEPEPHFTLSGLDFAPIDANAEDRWERDAFFVTVSSADLQEPPPVLGSYEYEGATLRFVPRFPLTQSVRYQMHLRGKLKQLATDSPLLFELPRSKSTPQAEVAAIFPSASELPQNLLKFYIHFSEPMSRGEAYERIHLFQGEQLIQDPFLELGEELWDVDQQRFTLFIHPGRIKRGLQPREQNGPAIEAGKPYTLKVDNNWLAANGQPLKVSYEKKFTVRAADHDQPNPELWKIQTPRKDSRQPVGLVFNEALDHAMLNRVLIVEHQDGRTIDGQISIQEAEHKWSFVPTENWSIGAHNIVVAANLEDLCGNSIARPFEVKMQERVASQPSTHIGIEFIVK